MNTVVFNLEELELELIDAQIDHNAIAAKEGLERDFKNNGRVYKSPYSVGNEREHSVTVVDIFSCQWEAKNAVVELQRQGLSCQNIWLIAHEYQAITESVGLVRKENGTVTENLTLFLNQLGISNPDLGELIEAIKDGNYLVVAIVTNQEASQAQHILKNIGHLAIAVY
ncbi:hypothetical protein Syn7502_02064 [Synechococcus sp. PCC 7502]|uniref:hypothetical protein n=1 Tax=Synechococcus sp. PCC 7502 TaxID=1173263 RepID=UPI00029F9692|nr:hypothetical protein [Synechococcus sp. PCC 7502]AFY74086.1 hypothetical protein Syn7502_02064 [Synechococcus sp. PCC 7502]